MPYVTMSTDKQAPVSWLAAESFDMERATSLVAIGQNAWPDATTPRTDKPVRFRPCTVHTERPHKRGTFVAKTVGYIFRA
jgi:hypothetical protein